jgi:hypothetical protein
MANNKTKIDQLHDLLPKHFNTKNNTNWSALLDAIGSADQDTANLVAEVRQQFFIKTASRPYLDNLAANNQISRPRFVGMDDPSFRQYIPILSYQPKQVKLIIDQLLDIFFFKESTTAFITTQNYQPFNLQNGWELEYSVDGINDEFILFKSDDFTDITSASADEIAAAINRQAQYSYATAEYDNITKNTYVRLYTKTVGSKGSLTVVGGRANAVFRLNGFIDNAGNGSNTSWTVTKIGDQVKFQYLSGTSPGINQLQVGDIAIIDIPGNAGSFPIIDVNLTNQSFSFINLFGTVTTVSQTSDLQVKFIRPNKYSAYLNPKRAMTWETLSGEITVEMPTSPPVVKRSLKGSAHINGAIDQMMSRNSNTSMTLADATNFPNNGSFWLAETQQIISHYLTSSENTTLSTNQNTRLIATPQKYTYTSRTAATTTGDTVLDQYQILNVANIAGIATGQQVVMVGLPSYTKVISIVGNTVNVDRKTTIASIGAAVSFLGNNLSGISPPLPQLAALNEFTNVSISRTSNIVTVTTALPHMFNDGDSVAISGCSGILSYTTVGDITVGSNLITNIGSTLTMAPGEIVVIAGFPVGTKILSISGATAALSNVSSVNATGTPIQVEENISGSFIIHNVTSNSYSYSLTGLDGSVASVGVSSVERPGLAPSGSIVILTTAIPESESRVIGPYMWDLSAPFVLSSNKGTIAQSIQAGKIIKLLNLNTNTISSTGGEVIFDYGLGTQEGPIRYLYKPTDNTISIDPSYTFKHDHSNGSSITMINHTGPHRMSAIGNEYAAYITDPSQARIVLEQLILSVKSSGIFVNFLIRYPEQLYGILDVYNQQGLGAGEPFQ